MTTQERPLITFILFAYNQERFIREAVEGAFSQTYSPLEIILSDDCSQDRTFEIIQEMASEYKGPHIIILNRNERNLGIGGHFNKIMELTRGELIVGAAGDDISMPNRVQIMYELWDSSNRNATSIYSSLTLIKDKGDIIKDYIQDHNLSSDPKLNDLMYNIKRFCPQVLGASHAWDRRIYDLFGPILSETVQEDRVISLRSKLLGQIVYTEKPLVLYRRHSENVSGFFPSELNKEKYRNYLIRKIKTRIVIYRNYLKDIQIAHNLSLINYETKMLAEKFINDWLNQYEFEIKFITSSRLKKIIMLPSCIIGREKLKMIIKYVMIDYWICYKIWLAIFRRSYGEQL